MIQSIFFACKCSSVFWDKMQLWLKERNVVKLNLSFIDIKYGNYEEDGKKGLLINVLLLLAKSFIHKCRFFKSPPRFIVFKNYLRQYLKTLSKTKNKKAGILLDLFNKYNLL